MDFANRFDGYRMFFIKMVRTKNLKEKDRLILKEVIGIYEIFAKHLILLSLLSHLIFLLFLLSYIMINKYCLNTLLVFTSF